MREHKKIRWASILSIMLIISFIGAYTCYAATNVTIKAGQSQVAAGKTVAVTITVPNEAEAWTYRVDYSTDCLKLTSGNLEPMGFAGESNRTNTLIFTATKVGTATVKVTGGKGISIGGKDYDASGSVTIKVVAVSNPVTPTPKPPSGSGSGSSTSKPTPTPTPDSRSGNNSLASLSVSEGTLSPAFSSSVTSYSVDLSSKTTSIKVDAKPSDSKSTVKGTGDIAVQPGANTINVVVTAENGTTKTYTITANVDEAPLVYTDYEDKSLGVVRNIKNVSIPSGFSEATVTLEGEQVKAWTNEASGITLLYLVDEEGNAGFYVYSPDKGVLSKYEAFQFNGHTYIYAGIDESLREKEGLMYGKVAAFDKTIDGFTYKDETLASFIVLYLMDEENNYNYYSYDTTNGTLQLFSGGVYSADGVKSIQDEAKANKDLVEGKLKTAVITRNISIVLAVVFMVATGTMGYNMSKSSKKLRRLRRRGSSDSQE